MENLTFDMLTHYSRSQLQMLIKAAKLSCPKLSRQKHEELIEFILQHQDQIGELPPVQTDGQGKVSRRGRKPKYSQEHKAIIEKKENTLPFESAPVHAEPQLEESPAPAPAPSAAPAPPALSNPEGEAASEPRRSVNTEAQEGYQPRPKVRASREGWERRRLRSIPTEQTVQLDPETLKALTEAAAEEEVATTPPRRRPVHRVSIERQADLRQQGRLTYEPAAPLEMEEPPAPRYGRRELARGYDSRPYEQSYYGPYEDYAPEADYEEPEPEVERLLPMVTGILDVRGDNYGFLRGRSFKISPTDVHVSFSLIKRYGLRMGDMVCGLVKSTRRGENSYDLERILSVNGMPLERAQRRPSFDQLVPIFPKEQFILETKDGDLTGRMVDLFAPIGKGQRTLIVSPPKAGKTICLKKIAAGIAANSPESILIALLVDERPEEVTDMERSIKGQVVASTFDEDPIQHIFISHLVLERARRLVELGHDVVLLLDSLTRLGRACNNATPNSGRTMSGGLDISALRMPKRFFGSARKFERGGSLTIIATALIDTGSRMDEVIFEEFKGTGNSEINLSRKAAERRVYPAIDIKKSGTRHDECLQSASTLELVSLFRRSVEIYAGERDLTEVTIEQLKKSASNEEFLAFLKKSKSPQRSAVTTNG